MLLSLLKRLIPLKKASAPLVQDSVVSCSTGGILFLKVCGYVEAEHAEILAVNETHLRLRIGAVSWFSRVFNGATPIEVCLNFTSPAANTENWLHTHASQAAIDVVIRPTSQFHDSTEFTDTARRALWRLRCHLLAM